MERADEELDLTVDTLIELDEPEALLATLHVAASRKKGKRWQALASVLGQAAYTLDHLLNAKGRPEGRPSDDGLSPAGPDFRPPADEAEAEAEAEAE